jgi:hypothetical protein
VQYNIDIYMCWEPVILFQGYGLHFFVISKKHVIGWFYGDISKGSLRAKQYKFSRLSESLKT